MQTSVYSLPTEIIFKACSYLPKSSLSRFSACSRKLRVLLTPNVFEEFTIPFDTGSNFGRFINYINNPITSFNVRHNTQSLCFTAGFIRQIESDSEDELEHGYFELDRLRERADYAFNKCQLLNRIVFTKLCKLSFQYATLNVLNELARGILSYGRYKNLQELRLKDFVFAESNENVYQQFCDGLKLISQLKTFEFQPAHISRSRNEPTFCSVLRMILGSFSELKSLKTFLVADLKKTSFGQVGQILTNNQLVELYLNFAKNSIDEPGESHSALMNGIKALRDHGSLRRLRLHIPYDLTENKTVEDFLHGCFKLEDEKTFELDCFTFSDEGFRFNGGRRVLCKLLPHLNPRLFEYRSSDFFVLDSFDENFLSSSFECYSKCPRLERIPQTFFERDSAVAMESFGTYLASNKSVREMSIRLGKGVTIDRFIEIMQNDRNLQNLTVRFPSLEGKYQLIETLMKLPKLKHLKISSDSVDLFDVMRFCDLVSKDTMSDSLLAVLELDMEIVPEFYYLLMEALGRNNIFIFIANNFLRFDKKGNKFMTLVCRMNGIPRNNLLTAYKIGQVGQLLNKPNKN